MSSNRRLVLTDDTPEEQQQQPKRNAAAGTRLAPLPPHLRGRVRGDPAVSARTVTNADFSSTAPEMMHPRAPHAQQQRSDNQNNSSRYNSNSMARLGGPDGRRHLPPVSQDQEQAGLMSGAFASTAQAGRNGRRSAPPLDTADHDQRVSNASGGRLGGSASQPATSSSSAPRTGPRISTSEGARRPSPSKVPTSISHAMHNTNGIFSTQSGIVAAGRGKQKPRAPVLTRPAGRSTANCLSERSPSEVEPVMGSGTLTESSAAANATTRAARPSTGLTAATSTRGGSAAEDVAVETTALPAAAEHVKARISEPEFPLHPHDMDEKLYTDKHEWRGEKDLPPLVWSLLEGTSLEAPYTSYLWTQAYPQPVTLLKELPLPVMRSNSHEDVEEDEEAKEEPLPTAFQHRDSEKRQGGFYACVRCGTPICSPDYQVIPASPALRGIAVFHRLHLKAVDLRLRTSVGDTPQPQRLCFQSISDNPSLVGGAMKSMNSANALLRAAGGELQLIAHCHHCNGCLGVMLIGETAAVPAIPSDLASSSPLSAGENVQSIAQELLCVNSVCLQYLRYRTRAALDGEVLGQSSRSNKRSSRSGGGALRQTSADAEASAATTGVTLGTLFDPPQHMAWRPLESASKDKAGINARHEGAGRGEGEDNSSESSFDELLDALNAYSGHSGYDCK